MSLELTFTLTLVSRIATAAAFVVTVSIITERSGPAIGALVASLPISAGPSYIFLALDHDAAFIAKSALASLPINAATIWLCLTYAVLAQHRGNVIALGVSVAVWLTLALILGQFEWTLGGGLIANAITFTICIPLIEPYRHATRVPLTICRWYDIPLRAFLVATLVVILIATSGWVGATISGTIALFPIVFVSIMLILPQRISGPATAAVIANGAGGMMGFGSAVAVLYLATLHFGSPVGLGFALATSVCWNLVLWWIGRWKPRPAIDVSKQV